MPNICKIGFTTLCPFKRAKCLYTTGVPYPFHVEFYIKSNNPRRDKKKIHKILENNNLRINKKREFFNVDKKTVEIIFSFIDDQIVYQPPTHFNQIYKN